MRKQKKQLIILIVILALLAVGYFVLRSYNEKEKVRIANENTSNQIYALNLSVDNVQKITYSYQGVEYEYKKEGDIWVYPKDTSITLKQDSVNQIVKNAAQLIADEEIDNVTDLEQYGLAEPANTIKIVTSDKEYLIHIGNYNSTISKYYIYTDDPTIVYTVGSSSITCYDKSVEDLTEEPSETEPYETASSETEPSETEPSETTLEEPTP